MTGIAATRVGVVGAGLIGGSVCRSLRASGVAGVSVYSPSRSTVDEVRHHGFVVVDSVRDVVAGSDVVFVCVPMGVQRSVLAEVVDAVRATGNSQVVVTDVASVKGDAAREAVDLFGSAGAAFIPGHPMAGTEESGFAASTATMFDGATWVLCPETAGPGEVLVLSQLVLAMKAKVSFLDIESHDRGVAAVSHLPHVLAATLVNSLPGGDEGELALRLAAGSFRDGSRVAGSEPWLSASMVNLNSANVRGSLDRAVGLLSGLRDALDRGDDAAVVGFFESARSVRTAYTAAKSQTATETVSVLASDAVATLGAACADGALVSSLAVNDDTWTVTLER